MGVSTSVKMHGEVNHRPGARPSAGTQTVLATVRFSSATTVEFTPAVNTPRESPDHQTATGLGVLQSVLLHSVDSPVGIEKDSMKHTESVIQSDLEIMSGTPLTSVFQTSTRC